MQFTVTLQPRFLLSTNGFSSPCSYDELPEEWQRRLDEVDWHAWVAQNLDIASYQGVDRLEPPQPPLPWSNWRATLSMPTHPDECQQVHHTYYEGRSLPVDILHRLEQQWDTGHEGYQWAYGLDDDTAVVFGDDLCILVFRVVDQPEV